ncbi:unnamed protein product [Rotaria sordida]|uniref:Uncharacterized protein n=1 Tax=Rotaria sordida TaxID=392033 RepID=A0A815N635_9BILA|nr:unnamed protein product [Rotaria sordida]CAF1496432.1 unnamed protein product [Rotaria sordida]CAF1653554.1 unnamed protein product [Rotaria sordida]CAF3908493.1 unnamed protein product [Rotaria sordida]CAF3992342.1 unnamed protein product [Rotaria sordida]
MDNQGRSNEQLAPTRALTEQEPQEKKHKKKCRGNRKAQRQRRRLKRRQAIVAATNMNLPDQHQIYFHQGQQ